MSNNNTTFHYESQNSKYRLRITRIHEQMYLEFNEQNKKNAKKIEKKLDQKQLSN